VRVSECVTYLSEVFKPFGAIRMRRMFGRYGIYHDDLMLALVADDALYLKADAQSSHDFEKLGLGLGRFRYEQKGRTVEMVYFAAPEAIFDDPEQALQWATGPRI
jgi:DNA transformation protein